MPNDFPLNLGPMVGYAMWHLSRREPAWRVLQMMEQDPRHGTFTQEQRNRALERAQQNVEALGIMRLFGTPTPLERAFRGRLQPGELVGARVNLLLSIGRDRPLEVSVTINVLGTQTQQDLIDLARRFFLSGEYRRRWRKAYQFEIAVDDQGRERIYIQALIQGGLPNPAIGPSPH